MQSSREFKNLPETKKKKKLVKKSNTTIPEPDGVLPDWSVQKFKNFLCWQMFKKPEPVWTLRTVKKKMEETPGKDPERIKGDRKIPPSSPNQKKQKQKQK